MEKTSLIIHGHFYQPPRENPRTGLIDIQESARPYKNWNERINLDCYKANTSSRFLNEYGQIKQIYNNYEYISYNFGPTLLSWLYENDRQTYELIIQADKNSVKRLGFGNAMAQGFSHTILPLDSHDMAREQINWGIKDFYFRYGREPEGIWLPEAAINSHVVDILAEEGIKFVVLSPFQAKAVQNSNNDEFTYLNGRPAPYDKPYILQGVKGREISAFFYQGQLASDISFGHALRSADSLYNNLLHIKNTQTSTLINTATDGEIYGHHEAYGDMALAALINKVEKNEDFKFTNYATYLNEHKAEKYALLVDGEESKGSSWSCFHGVSRWYKDCGCNTGGKEGWNQKWRTPLRNSIADLALSINSEFDSHIKEIFKAKVSTQEILDKAAALYIGQTKACDLIKQLHKDYKFDSSDDTKLATLLDGILNLHYSFSSCGFFFNDLAGIEPKQSITYALYAIDEFSKYTNKDLLSSFVNILKEAKSNEDGDGLSIISQISKEMNGEIEAAIYFFLNYNIDPECGKNTYGRYTLKDIKINDNDISLSIFDEICLINYNYNMSTSSTHDQDIKSSIYIHELDEKKFIILQSDDIKQSILLDMASTLNNYAIKFLNKNYIEFTSALIKWLNFKYKDIEDDELVKSFVSKCINFLSYITKNIDSINLNDELIYNLKIMVDFISEYASSNIKELTHKYLNDLIASLAKTLKEKGMNDEFNEFLFKLLSKIEKDGKIGLLDLREIQNEYYKYYLIDKDNMIFKRLNFE